jgi:molybdate transport system substrate-binding protein
MGFLRRELLGAAPAFLATTLGFTGKAATATTTDLAVTCDTAAAPAVIAAGAAFRQKTGVRIRVFPTPPGLVLPQLEREIQNDIVVTQITTIDQAEQAGLIQPGDHAGIWRNRLVTAAARNRSGEAGTFAVPDPSPASDIDGIAILHALGLAPSKILGVIDTSAVAWLLNNGGAHQGLLHQTEVTSDPDLQAMALVPDGAWPPIVYAATVTKLARRGDPASFVRFLASPEGRSVLRNTGLEAA